MAEGSRRPRGCSTICLPIDQDLSRRVIDAPQQFRGTLDQLDQDRPELFPKAMASGSTLKDDRLSARLGRRLRRIRCKATGAAFAVRPSFALASRVGRTDDVEGPLFLRVFGVPFWALARVFGKGPTSGYRLEVGLGRDNIVGTTVRRADVPAHLLADEHHQPREGEKNDIATTAGAGCCLGACLAQTAGAEGLQTAYAVFREEAEKVQPDYRPEPVRVDGWAATRQAWLTLFPLVVLWRCFLHGWLNIRSRGKPGAAFAALPEKVWHAYQATDRRAFAQRLRRLREWARGQGLTAWLLEQVAKLCGRSEEYAAAYGHPGGQRTGNMLDRVMRSMNRDFDAGQDLHGSQQAGERHCRGWALVHTFRPWGPEARRDNGCCSPAERLNQHRYHENWLHNLLVSASLAGFRR
jgi:hypothetical protein